MKDYVCRFEIEVDDLHFLVMKIFDCKNQLLYDLPGFTLLQTPRFSNVAFELRSTAVLHDKPQPALELQLIYNPYDVRMLEQFVSLDLSLQMFDQILVS